MRLRTDSMSAPGSARSGGAASGNHLSGRIQAVYDAFYEDAHKKRVMKAAEKERRMADMSRLMNEGATAANIQGLSEAEAAALRDA